jgi:hypothetical protein
MKNLLVTILLALLFGLGCNSKSDSDLLFATAEMDIAYDAIPITRMESPPPPPAYGMEKQIESRPTDGQQKLIKTIRLRIEVANFSTARTSIDSLIKLNNAWVSNENMYNTNYEISTSITIRVPSTSLDNLSNQIIGIAKKVDSQNIETLDVTEEFIDVQSRLKNKRTLEQKFISLLRRTDSIEEILKIETKLAEIRSEIESHEGRLKYLQSRVEYNTVYLNVYQSIDYKFVPEPMERFWERFKNSVHKGWLGFVAFLLFLIKLWPLWIIVAIIGVVVFSIRKRKQQKHNPEKRKKGKSTSKDKKSNKADAPI